MNRHRSAPRRAQDDTARRTRVRYWVLLMIFIVTTVNYADRATLSITGPAMRKEFGFDTIQMGYIFSAFSWAYVLVAAAGRLAARPLRRAQGLRGEHLLLVALHAAAGLDRRAGRARRTAVATLFVMRFFVGVAEAPAFPANAKVVASWFPTAGARHGVGDLQLGAVLRGGRLHAADGRGHALVRLAHGLRRRWAPSGMVLALAVVELHAQPGQASAAVNRAELEHIEAGGGLVHMGERGGTAGRAHCPKGQTALLREAAADQPHAARRLPRPVLHQRADLLLPDLVPGLPGAGAPHDDPEGRLHGVAAGDLRLRRRRARRRDLRLDAAARLLADRRRARRRSSSACCCR